MTHDIPFSENGINECSVQQTRKKRKKRKCCFVIHNISTCNVMKRANVLENVCDIKMEKEQSSINRIEG